jgi:hypothetical protein
MKRWMRRDEWAGLSACGGSDVHTAERPSESDSALAISICARCVVRPECIEWAVREKACSVFVAGVYLPDPKHKSELKALYSRLESSIPSEQKLRGDEVD